jgi:hypothetical protein
MRIDDEVLQSLRSPGPRARPRSRFSRPRTPEHVASMAEHLRLGLPLGNHDALDPNPLSRPTPGPLERKR